MTSGPPGGDAVEDGPGINVRLLLEYDGQRFHGWQRQPQRPTVEDEVALALHRLTGQDPPLIPAGRTDAGAHAEGQVINFRYSGSLPPSRLMSGLNALLPTDVVVLEARAVSQFFHSRYSARRRVYRYSWLDRRARPVLDRARVFHVRGPLDDQSMARAALPLIGVHDWTTFCSATGPDQNRIREMASAGIERSGDRVDLTLVGQGFLRGLARGLAGGLTEVGLGRRPATWMAEILEARDRSRSPKPAPACGLTLVRVEYE